MERLADPELHALAQAREEHRPCDERSDCERDQSTDARLVLPQQLDVTVETPAQQVPPRVPDDLEADKRARKGVEMVHVVERQILTQVRALQDATKVVRLGEKQDNVKRVVEVGTEARTGEEDEARIPSHADGLARADAYGLQLKLRSCALSAASPCSIDAEARRCDDLGSAVQEGEGADEQQCPDR